MNAKPAILGNTPVFSNAVPLVRPSLPSYEAMAPEVAELFASGMLTKGKHLREFERRLSAHLQVEHAVCVSSCTLGLLLLFQALDLTGEVIVPSFTFMATVHPLIWNGLTPIFVDIDSCTWNIDPAKVEAAITPRTSAIVAVHNFGNPAEVQTLEAVARRHALTMVFDAAHGFGSLYRGQPVGPFGDAEAFSLSPTKLLVTGEGGVVTTNNARLADKLRVGREYGNPGDYGSDFPGLNGRLPEFNALLGVHGLDGLEENAQLRNRVASAFRDRLGALPGLAFQQVHERDRSSHKDFSVLVDASSFGLSRDELALALKSEQIDSRKYHDPPVHTHKAYRSLWAAQRSSLPVTDDVARKSLSLPLWSHMDEQTIAGICTAFERAHRHAGEIHQAVLYREAGK